MKKSYLRLLIIIIAVLTITLIILFNQFKNNEINITINEKDRDCTSDTDCAVVSISCGDCDLDSVNKVYTTKYELKLEQICKDKYPKTECDVDYRDTHEIECVNLKCILVSKQ